MKKAILSVEKIKKLDELTIKNKPIASIDLMERAATECFKWITTNVAKDVRITIFCGKGNNGGDGLAISRMLLQDGYNVETYICETSKQGTSDFEVNLKRLEAISTSITLLNETNYQNFINQRKLFDVAIDAIFGVGLNKPISGWLGEIIDYVNNYSKYIISIDVPSGLFIDKTSIDNKHIVKANHVLTFHYPKLAFLLPENEEFCNDFTVLDIGLIDNPDVYEQDFYNGQCFYSFDISEATQLIKKRRKFSHKGNYGHALIIGGSRGKMGAAILASRACLRSGAGLVTAHVPAHAVQIFQSALPEVMLSIDEDENLCRTLPDLNKYDSIAIGPGIGTDERTANLLKLLIQNVRVPLVLDADAINIMAGNKTWLSFIPPLTIFTPHPKEFERLFGKTRTNFDRLELQQEMSEKYNIIIILKGAHTSISFPDRRVWFCMHGNPGMATGGSGDVLTGIIAGLLAQNYQPEIAALLGVVIHSYAGDLASNKTSQTSLIASDIIENLKEVFLYLEKAN